MTREPFRAGALGGWVEGDGPPVLLLHGGPGLSFDYLDWLADEIGPGYRVAAFQQRGLEPSTVDGPFDMPTRVQQQHLQRSAGVVVVDLRTTQPVEG